MSSSKSIGWAQHERELLRNGLTPFSVGVEAAVPLPGITVDRPEPPKTYLPVLWGGLNSRARYRPAPGLSLDPAGAGSSPTTTLLDVCPVRTG